MYLVWIYSLHRIVSAAYLNCCPHSYIESGFHPVGTVNTFLVQLYLARLRYQDSTLSRVIGSFWCNEAHVEGSSRVPTRWMDCYLA